MPMGIIHVNGVEILVQLKAIMMGLEFYQSIIIEEMISYQIDNI